MPEPYSPNCLVGATEDVVELKKPVQIMIRIEPTGKESHYGLGDGQMSGWLFMTGEEDEGPAEIYSLQDVLEHNPSIAAYLDRPAPCRLDRDELGDGFHEVDEPDDDEDEIEDDEDFSDGDVDE